MIISIILCIIAIIVFYRSNKKPEYIDYVLPFQKRKDCRAVFIGAYLNGKPFYFLVDSGASCNCLDSSRANVADYKFIGSVGAATANSTEVISQPIVSTLLKIKNYEEETEFQMLDLDVSFSQYYEQYGIRPIGIIGDTYISKHNWVIDYRNNVIVKFK